MTTTALSVSASATASTTSKLVKAANDEYTASSVAADQTDAIKLGLQKEKDGNYGTANPNAAAKSSSSTVSTSGSAAATASASVQSALTLLTLGGA